MAHLDLFIKRQPHTVTLESLDTKGKPHDYKIPTEYTLDETELLLQHQVNVDKISKRTAEKGKESEDLLEFFEAVLVQLHVLFLRYQPEMTVKNLKTILTKEEAIAMWAFFIKERLELVDGADKVQKSKKKATKKS